MKKIVLLLLTLGLLLGGLYYFTQKYSKSSIDISDRQFAIENIDEVNKIFIASRNSEPITIERKGESWFVNDTLLAKTRTVNSTLDALENMEIAYIPTKKAYKPIMEEIAALGVKVEVYNRADKLMKSFYIGGTSPDGRATQMIMEGAEQPYMMKIKGVVGSILPRFVKRRDDWRDNFVFSKIFKQVDTLQIVYPRQQKESFVLGRKGKDQWTIRPYFATTPVINQELDHSVVQNYLYEISKTAIEGFKNAQREQFDETKDQTPFALVYMKYQDGTSDEYKFYPLVDSKREADFRGNLFTQRDKAMERLRIISKNGDYMLGQFHLMNRIFWGYSFFFNNEQ